LGHGGFAAVCVGGGAPLRFRRISFALSALLLIAAAPPVRFYGTDLLNRPACGLKYVKVDLGHGDYFNVINAPAGNTCVVAERHHLSWYVSSWRPAARSWQYPNISSGIEWGRYTCDDGRSGAPSSPGGRCMRYPVRADRDGEPVTSGIAWDVMSWIAYKRTTGTSWRYVAYLAHQQRDSVSRLWLNPFFRDAERWGELSPTWYLTAIDFGAEINETVRGAGFDVASYSLTGVN
jgi:hypothetical protein